MQFSPAVLEVFDLLDIGRFLKPVAPLAHAGWLIEPSLARAVALAGAAPDGSEEDDGVTFWTELCEHRAAKVWGIAGATPSWTSDRGSEIWERVNAAWKQLVPHRVRPRIPREYLELEDFVPADILHIATNRALGGSPDSFFERLFAVYAAGGWPCGWSGMYPDGKLVVFDPRATAS
jgi:hypothetical protein